jgi:hypothetical protein
MQYGNNLEPQEFETLRDNIANMQIDLRVRYDEVLEASHSGTPVVIQTVRNGGPGRPRTQINPVFLAWAYSQRSTSAIAHFLNVGRTTVRRLLLEHGIVHSGAIPANIFPPDETDNQLLDPTIDVILDPPGHNATPQIPDNHPGYLSSMTDDELDALIISIRSTFSRTGISMMDGMLRRLGHRVQYQRIRASLIRIDPVHRIFERIRIRRRGYRVPGPNALWHHDGQHGTIFTIFWPRCSLTLFIQVSFVGVLSFMASSMATHV